MKIDAYTTVGVDREYDLTAGDLLRQMDAAGVDRAVVAPVDRAIAVYNREGNGYVLAAAREHPDRLIPACTANPWFGSAAAAELRRAVAEGSRLVVLHPLIQGFQANDELVWPLLEVARGEQVPVYLHTGPPGSASPWMIVDLAERFPEVDFLMGHCGATDFWNDVVAAARTCHNVTLESSHARPFNFASYLRQLGETRGVLGSCAPLNDLALEWEQMRKVLEPPAWEAVYGGNLQRLLEKRGPL